MCSVASVPTATVVGEGRRGEGKNDRTEYNKYFSSPGFTKKGLSLSTDFAEGGGSGEMRSALAAKA